MLYLFLSSYWYANFFEYVMINEDFCRLARRERFLSGDILKYVEH